jgi:hypothetical protein
LEKLRLKKVKKFFFYITKPTINRIGLNRRPLSGLYKSLKAFSKISHCILSAKIKSGCLEFKVSFKEKK